jgi:hypothetical protein
VARLQTEQNAFGAIDRATSNSRSDAGIKRAPTVPYRRHGHTTVSREKSEGALQQAAVTETGA